MATNNQQQTCEGNANHIGTIPQGSAFQGQKKQTH